MDRRELEELLATIPGVNVKLPRHLQPPFGARAINAVRAYENFDRAILIDPVIGYVVPGGHRAIINMIGIGVNYEDKLATWTNATYWLYAQRNGVPYDLLNPPGTIPNVGAFAVQSDNLIALANEASVPVGGAGAVVSGLNDNPFGLTNMIETLIQLEEGDDFRLIYDGGLGAADVGHYLYARLCGWVWNKQEQAEGDIGA